MCEKWETAHGSFTVRGRAGHPDYFLFRDGNVRVSHVLAYINIRVCIHIHDLYHSPRLVRSFGPGLWVWGSECEAPLREQSLIMSSISGGIESARTHTEINILTHTRIHTRLKGVCGLLTWLQISWKLRPFLGPRWSVSQQLRGVQERKHFITPSPTHLASLPPTPLSAKQKKTLAHLVWWVVVFSSCVTVCILVWDGRPSWSVTLRWYWCTKVIFCANRFDNRQKLRNIVVFDKPPYYYVDYSISCALHKLWEIRQKCSIPDSQSQTWWL